MNEKRDNDSRRHPFKSNLFVFMYYKNAAKVRKFSHISKSFANNLRKIFIFARFLAF